MCCVTAAFRITKNFYNDNLQINLTIWEINEIALVIRTINICHILMIWAKNRMQFIENKGLVLSVEEI